MRLRPPGISVALSGALLYLATSCGSPPPRSDAPYFFVDHLSSAKAEFDERRFRSARPDGRMEGQVTFGRETRRAILPPLPSRLVFDVDVPANATLRFAIAVSTLGAEVLPAPVSFRIRLQDGASEETTVFDGRVARRQPNRFLLRDVDLSRWSGSRVRLAFETGNDGSSAEGAELPVVAYWANPVLAPDGPDGPDQGDEGDEGDEREPKRPNVILISLDCVRADHLGAYGYPRSTSPRLDELARDAVVFETAMSVSAWTHPTHLSMLTGLPPSIHGVSRWRKPDGSIEYLPEVLAGAGYRTLGVVSGPLLTQNFGFERGFEVYRAFHEETRAPEVADAALEMLRRGRGTPQFLFLHFFDVHWPYWPTEEFNTRFGPRAKDASGLLYKVRHQVPPDDSDREEEIQQTIDLYDGELAYLDRELGRFFDELKRMGLYDSSLVLVTADHGEAFQEHGFWEHGQTLYEEMVHVPLLVKWPGGDHPKGRVRSLVSQIDYFPTILEAAGLKPRGEGTSLRRTLEHPEGRDREVVLEQTWDPLPDRPARMLVAWRGEKLKYIASFEAPTVDDLYPSPIRTEELYDLERDPHERNNIASTRKETLHAMRGSVLHYLERARELRAQRKGEEVELDPELRERLESLGYLTR